MKGLTELNKWFRIMAVVEVLIFGFELIYHHLWLMLNTMVDMHNTNQQMNINMKGTWIPTTEIYFCLVAAGIFVLASLITTFIIMIKEKKNKKAN